MTRRIAGTAYVKVDGDQLELAGSLTASPAEFEREGLSGLSGVVGYKETPRVPFIEGEFHDVPEASLTALQGATDATVTAELANGKVAVIRNAWLATAPEVNAAEGTVTLRFEGMQGQWMESAR